MQEELLKEASAANVFIGLAVAAGVLLFGAWLVS